MADLLFVHTDALKTELASFLGPNHPPIVVTPHGVWMGPSDAGVTLPQKLTRRQLLFFGSIRENKGLHLLLEAMQDLDDCTLVVAGAPHEQAYFAGIVKQVATLPSGRVRLLGRFVTDDEMDRLFSESSVVVLPYTRFAAQSGVLHAAIAATTPVVVCDVGALGETVALHGIGVVVPPRDANALVDGVRKLLNEDVYYNAVAGCKRARLDSSWNRTAETLLRAYAGVLAGATDS